jgi:hypothetical protein
LGVEEDDRPERYGNRVRKFVLSPTVSRLAGSASCFRRPFKMGGT